MKTKVKETYEVLKDVVNSLNLTFNGDTYTDNLDWTFTIEACDTLWLTIGFEITIGVNTYTVVDINPNEWIKIKGSVAPTTLIFNIYAPKYEHGTISAQSVELAEKANSWEKLPIIYLHEITRERFDINPENTVDRESDCDLHFLIDCNIEDWKTVDHYKYAIRPMRNLLFAFVEALYESDIIGLFEDYEVLDHAKWGVYTDNGHTKMLFSEYLSGSQLKITIPILKELNCNNTCI